jgi:hypothetical protein
MPIPESYSPDQVRAWLATIAGGTVDLAADNEGLATAALYALGFPVEPVEPAPPPVEPLPPGNLSPHFTMAELTRSATADSLGIDNTPDPDSADNLAELAQCLELVRSICGDNPVLISSGYRSPPVNQAVGGATNSAHLFGLAADFTIPAFGDVLAICREVEPHMATLGIDQLIDESGGGARWVHLGLPIPPNATPRLMCLTIANGVTTTGFA